MAREKRPVSPGNRPNLDYYEYKRRHDEQLKRTNPELAKAVAASIAEMESADEAEAPRRKRSRKEARAADMADVRVQPDEPAVDVPIDTQTEKPEPVRAAPVEGDAGDDDAYGQDGELDDELKEQVDHPFAEAAEKVKLFGGKLLGLTASLRGKLKRKEAPDEDDEDELDGGDEPVGAQEKALGDLASVLAIADDGASTPSRRARRAHQHGEDEAAEAPANERTGEQLEHAPIEASAAPAPVDIPTPVDVPAAPVRDVEVPAAKAEAAPAAQPVEEAPRRVTRKKAEPVKAQEDDEYDEDDEGDAATEKRKRFWMFGKPVKSPTGAGGYEDDDEDDEDIAPSGGRFSLFGRKRAREEAEYEDDDIIDEDDLSAERLSARLASTLDEERAPRRRRKAAEPEPEPEKEAEPEVRRFGRRARQEEIALDEPDDEPYDNLYGEDEDEDEQASDRPPLDEPTQAFRPLNRRAPMDDGQRTRRFKPVRTQEEPDDDDEDYEDEDDYADEDDLPVRRYGRKPRRAAVRVYQDEDLIDDDEDDDDLGDARYDDDDDDYDEFDDDEDTLSFGKRLLRFLKGLLIIVLILLLSVITLRQLESNGVISLNILRNTVGVLVPLDGLFPTPEPTAIPTPTPEAEPTAPIPTPAVVTPTVTGEAAADEAAVETPAATGCEPASMGVELPDNGGSSASAAFLDDEEAGLLDDIGD